jgi:hypothetical protein
MKRVVSLGCLIAVLSVFLMWEVVTQDDNVAPADVTAPAGPSQTAKGTADKASPHEFDAEALADIAASVTARPLFSSTRRPSAVANKSAGSATALEAVPRLTGVIIGPSGGWAIFADANGKSHAAAAGDAIGAFKVRAISPGIVTLTGSEGDRVLRPTFVTSPTGSTSEIPGPEVTPSFVGRGNRNREGSR